MAPFIIWFAKNGALNDLWQSYIIFNSMYSKSSQGGGKILSYAKTFVYFICNPIFIFAAISCIIMCIKNYKNNGKIYIYSLLYTGLTLVLICLSGKKYAHYGITMIPCIALLLSLSIDFYKYIADNYFKSSKKYIVIFAFALLVGVYALQARNINDFDSNGENIKQICEIVTSRTNDDDKISVYGNFDIIYVNTKRIPVSKYSYQVPIKSVMPKISDEYFEALQKELPKIIVIEKDKYENSIEEFLAKNDYNLIWQSKSGENKSKTEMYLVYERVY